MKKIFLFVEKHAVVLPISIVAVWECAICIGMWFGLVEPECNLVLALGIIVPTPLLLLNLLIFLVVENRR